MLDLPERWVAWFKNEENRNVKKVILTVDATTDTHNDVELQQGGKRRVFLAFHHRRAGHQG